MSVVIDGKAEEVTGVLTRSFLDDPSLHLAHEDCAPRGNIRVRGIVLHTTEGRWPQVIYPGVGKPGGAVANDRYWQHDGRCAGAHLIVDSDGTVFCVADLQTEQTYHAESVNPVTIGIEIVQRNDGGLYSVQLETGVVLVDFLTRRCRIQRQIPDVYRGSAIARLHAGAHDFVGVFGHRDQSDNRGRGDPGDAVFLALDAAGYERVNIRANDDIALWKARQSALGFTGDDVDGVPLDKTCAALEAAGHVGGLWVERPGDK